MAIQIDPVITKKLLLVKQLYQQAISQSKVRYSDVGRITSIVIFDLATETMLKTIAFALDPKNNAEKTFEALIQQTDDLMVKASLSVLPHKTQIRHVHSIRNDAQHKARYPTDTEVNDCRTYTRDFLNECCLQIWGKDFEKISMLDVIRHEEVKLLLSTAEIAFSENNYEKALAYAKEGLDRAIFFAGRAVARSINDQTKGFITYNGYEQMIDTDLLSTFKEMTKLSIIQTLGINSSEFIKYESLANRFIIYRYADGFAHQLMRSLPSVEDIEFAINYSVNTVAQIEGFVGDLEHPFGKQFNY